MSAFDRSELLPVELPDILTDIAAPRVPDYVDDLLVLTAATRQRPRWTFLERWLPMGVIARRPLFFPTVPWRTLVTVAVLIALLAAALIVAGSRNKVPPPFGLARNGAIVFGSGQTGGGDIFAKDSLNGPERLLIGGSTDDFAAGFTRSGTQLIFLRRTSGVAGGSNERIQPFIANTDGTNIRSISESLVAPDWFDWSPDDSTLVVQTGDPKLGQHLYIVDLARGASRQLDVGRPMTMSFPNFRGPDGAEIVFRGETSTNDGYRSGIFAVHPDGSGLRQITPTNGDRNDDYMFPQPSPDGRLVAYTAWNAVAEKLQMHLVDLASGSDRLLSTDSPQSQGFATFSPDGGRIIFVTYFANRNQILVKSLEGGGPPLQMGPSYEQVDGQYVSGIFSPDGTKVIVNDPASKETRIIDATIGGYGEVLPWTRGDLSGWQRLAP